MHRGDDNSTDNKIIQDIQSWMLSLNLPKNFMQESEINTFRIMDSSFEQLCFSMEHSGIIEPKKLSVFEFNSKIVNLEKMNKNK